MNLTIRGRAWIDGALKDRSVKIEDGRIAAIDDGITGDSADALVLGPREILLPSATDLQCAMRDWAEAERETVETCTKAALAGGVTTVGDQANTVPRIHKLELVEKRARDVAATAFDERRRQEATSRRRTLRERRPSTREELRPPRDR